MLSPEESMQQTMAQFEIEEPSVAEAAVTELGDKFGYEWILGLAALGLVIFTWKKIKEWLK